MHKNNSVIENETNGLNDPVRINSDGLHISKFTTFSKIISNKHTKNENFIIKIAVIHICYDLHNASLFSFLAFCV